MKTRTSVSRQPHEDVDADEKGQEFDVEQSDESETKEVNNAYLQSPRRQSSLSKNRRKLSRDKPRKSEDEQLDSTSEQEIKEKQGKYSRSPSATVDRNNNLKSSDRASSPRKAGDKKGRNLDRVLRRMLKAKKENEKQFESCKSDEIKSFTADIKSASGIVSTKHNFAEGTGGSQEQEAREDSGNKSTIKLGMIDVQLSNSNHLPATERGTDSVNASGVVQRHGSPRDVTRYSSPNNSPDSYAVSDNEKAKPFVHSSYVSVQDSETSGKRDEENMSPIIKQEPVSAIDGRLAMYHTNGPTETHSPPSSYGSNPSPAERSPSPTSPGGGSTGALPSPPELIMNATSQARSPASNPALVLMNGSTNSYLPTMVPPHSSPLAYARRSPGGHSPHSILAYTEEMGRSPGAAAAAMAASGIGLPTLVPAMSAIPQNGPPHMFHMAGLPTYADPTNVYNQTRRGESDARGPKVSPNAPLGPNPPRGIVGQKEAAANEGRGGSGNKRGSNVDEKCAYKRPPHTYPALIASAILDSPGNLITLRGIYDYIMNNFPYYKFGHDKSAWQNSIRHNLSLNQCFVKVPRYENAAKSNYWTMTREGFEEFGNENSFKRRRRRGATLAPISAYKSKKYGNNEGNANNRSAKQRNGQIEGIAAANGLNKEGPMSFMGYAGRSRTPEPNVGYNNALKRSGSPGASQAARREGKHPRMLVLKQGEGPTLEGLSGGRSDHPQRPNSLSSVEEMQGNLNSFSKTLSGSGDGRPGHERSPRRGGQGRNSPSMKKPTQQQQWMMAAAQKNFGLLPPGLIDTLATTSSESYAIKNHALDVQAKMSQLGAATLPVILDHVEIGTQVPLFFDNSPVPTWSFLCRFCEFKHIDETPSVLEQHCRLVHHMEFTNAKAKAVAAAAVAGGQREADNVEKHASAQDQAGSLMSLQSMVSGFPPSMLAAAAGYNNAQSLLAAAHAAGITLPGSVPLPSSMSVSNAASSTSPYFTDPVMRSLAQQIGATSPDHNSAAKSEAQRQQFAALQQAVMGGAAGSVPQEQLRQMLYQQFLMQNPFFASNPGLTAVPRQLPGSRSDMSPLAQFLQYQQKIMEMSSQNPGVKSADGDEREKNDAMMKQSPDNVASRKSPSRKRKGSSSSASSGHDATHHSTTDDADKQSDIHGWKQCQDCDFTAKGAHGLELHFRKAHGSNSRAENGEMRIGDSSPVQDATSHDKAQGASADAQVTRRLSGNALDLSGSKTDNSASSGALSTAATQTDDARDVADERRSCPHCDVTFGDDTMHALHMSCHDRTDPFKCTICGQACHEKYYFNVHLLRGLHQPTQAKEKRPEAEASEKSGRRHSNTSEKSFSSTCSEGRNTPRKPAAARSPSSVSLPEVANLSNGDVSADINV